MQRPTFDEVATFGIAIVILIASFYGLLRPDGATEARVIYGGLIGSVVTFYFQRAATKAAHANTIDAQNNGFNEIRKGVTRIEEGRIPTEEERKQRDTMHP